MRRASVSTCASCQSLADLSGEQSEEDGDSEGLISKECDSSTSTPRLPLDPSTEEEAALCIRAACAPTRGVVLGGNSLRRIPRCHDFRDLCNLEADDQLS
eukprot:CAMPEP_0113824798 /NCGR_PEP_ID=MMETSP0328-20130328/3425_1 /TAXON_ID=39455 /ORGANISM="Alexandrium minutum" /LENGTH=99 /DNA_ID=CAMNT_0000792743 /DNA_START=15 /DNA_END=314 /DNA_ORIENTATION=+ /assembly_acc=CAM_ASM_000350